MNQAGSLWLRRELTFDYRRLTLTSVETSATPARVIFSGDIIGGGVGSIAFTARASWQRERDKCPWILDLIVEIRDGRVAIALPVEPGAPELQFSQLLELKNCVRRIAQSELDLQGAVLGAAFLVVLTSVQTPGNQPMSFFTDIGAPPLREDMERSLSSVLRGEGPSAPDPRADYVRHAVADLRRAILEPDDTAAFCFRAIEAIRQTFLDPRAGRNTDQLSWAAMSGALRCERTWTDALRDLGTRQRHGDRRDFCSGNERVQFYERARELVARYAVLLTDGVLEESRFPVLS